MGAALVAIAGFFAVAGANACTGVTSPSALCPAAANPCFIDGKQCTVVAGTVLDFGARAVVLRQGSRLDVGSGLVTIRAGSLELQPGTGLIGDGGSIVVQTTGGISVLKAGTTNARIDVAHPVEGGSILLVSQAGTIDISGIVDARGTNTDGGGGTISLDATAISVSGDVLGAGGGLGIGGTLALEASSSISVSGTIDGIGGISGASLDIQAGDSITTTGRIDIRATRAGGLGGFLTLGTATGGISLGGSVFLQGDSGTDLEGGADGGDLYVSAAGALTVGAAIEDTGAKPDGQGGDLQFRSVLDLAQTGSIQAQGKGERSAGGSLSFDSEHKTTLGNIDAHGGANEPDSGGTIEAQAWCDIFIPSGRLLTTEGIGGNIALRSGGQIIVGASLRAGKPITLQYQALTPMVAGASFLPEVEFQLIPDLVPCGGVPTPGCGDNTTNPPAPNDPGEECDDGNTLQCDGCSPACTLEACGNGVVDCGEVCDDGNTSDGDSCHGDCTRLDNVCGDHQVDSQEACDDGNLTPCDGCSDQCHVEGCGNGTVECGEECEPPGLETGCLDECTTFIPPGCGDATTNGTEECDDGNPVDGDGCSHQCRLERCGNGVVDPNEDCDDLNTNACDDCSPSCKAETCGNGVVDCGEECDDGAANGTPGSRCLPVACRKAPVCTVGSSEPCVPCATVFDCDAAAGRCGTFTCDANGQCAETTPLVCDDGNRCNGTELCIPATGCRAGTPLDCTGSDRCVAYACDATTGCTADTFLGFSLMRCRLGVARDLVNAALPPALATTARRKLLKLLGSVEQKLVTAEANARKAGKALRAATQRVAAAQRFVVKQRGKRIAADTADALQSALGALPPALVLPAS